MGVIPDTALRHMKAANRICYKGLFAVWASGTPSALFA